MTTGKARDKDELRRRRSRQRWGVRRQVKGVLRPTGPKDSRYVPLCGLRAALEIACIDLFQNVSTTYESYVQLRRLHVLPSFSETPKGPKEQNGFLLRLIGKIEQRRPVRTAVGRTTN